MYLGRICGIFLLSLLLAACGGGGSSGGGGQTGGSGGFEIAANSAAFSVVEDTYSSKRRIALKVTGTNVSYVGAAFPNPANQPSWLAVDITGSGVDYYVEIDVYPYGLAPGNYTATFDVGTANSNGDVLQKRSISVSLQVTAALSFSNSNYSGSFAYGAAPFSAVVNQPFTGSPGVNWVATSSESWLLLDKTSGTGGGSIETTVNTQGLTPGNYMATLAVYDNTNNANVSVINYFIEITEPIFELSTETILIGGEDGLGAQMGALAFSLNAGGASHPYTLHVITSNHLPWLFADKTSGYVGAAGETIQIIVDAASLVGGTYTGNLLLSVQVGELEFTREIPVTVNKEANRISLSATGIALSSAPSRSVLTRRVKVFSSLNRDDTAWTAVADQPWLTVTAAGETGDYIELTATTTDLELDTVHFATVSVTSTDADVENQESIRVGLVVSSTDAVDVIFDLPKTESSGYDYVTDRPFLVASPVEPLVFTNIENVIKAYNVYTAAEVRSFSGAVAKPGAMTMSGDGRSLFVYDQTNIEVVELNAVTGTVIHRYSASSPYQHTPNIALHYMRPNGVPILLGAGFNVYNITTHENLASEMLSVPNGVSLSGAEDPSWVVNNYGTLWQVNYSSLNGGGLRSAIIFEAYTSQGALGQACVNAQGTRVYTASGAPYEFPGTGIMSRNIEQVLPGDAYPTAIVCGWNGLIIGGAAAYYSAVDIFIYNGFNGQNLGNISSSSQLSYRNLVKRGLALSGDATRLIAISENNFTINRIRFYSLPEISE